MIPIRGPHSGVGLRLSRVPVHPVGGLTAVGYSEIPEETPQPVNEPLRKHTIDPKVSRSNRET